eukprot:NODE_10367_length_596_cov_93.826638_g10093_i0.p1 GENE.NODE_10367_length_596_cov_93.826638_g10093_i0~~NODE_10367_length_596_cov_93.826638_g10093_i0.p1  ORF type:complete len:177 (-),score=18.28 NODE_10367_length_596_cov_93.826638_g10093_i0:4-534(-)
MSVRKASSLPLFGNSSDLSEWPQTDPGAFQDASASSQNWSRLQPQCQSGNSADRSRFGYAVGSQTSDQGAPAEIPRQAQPAPATPAAAPRSGGCSLAVVPEILNEIFMISDALVLAELSLVCKRWRKIITANPVLVALMREWGMYVIGGHAREGLRSMVRFRPKQRQWTRMTRTLR